MCVIYDRFILTTLWFLISVGRGGNSTQVWSHSVVVDAQEVVKDEIWTITIQNFSPVDDTNWVETVYVLESTCEVIGRPSVPANPTDSFAVLDASVATLSTKHVRADWSAYIAHRQLPTSAHDSPPPPLLAYLKWQNHEEYYRGLSKVWLKRIASEGELGSAKSVVAHRYVLACIVGNRCAQLAFFAPQVRLRYGIGFAVLVDAGCLLLKWNKTSLEMRPQSLLK